ncbi:MAG: tRNA lysidine(34) synthetase TilS [Christensenellales bacterium]
MIKIIPEKNVKIGVAVSGGVDSMVLLRLYMESGADFCVINIEHGIRGESSAKDSEFVRNFCEANGVECHIIRVDAPAYAKKYKISIELAARELRYAVFEDFLAKNAVQRIALAHHADDNAETVLMRIFRGTGIRGLKGISDRGAYIRPLKECTRSRIAEYAEKNGVKYVEDETNSDSAYTRNFIRNELMPLVKNRYPHVEEAILRLSRNAEEVDEFLEKSTIKPEKTTDGYVLRDLYKAEKIIQKYSVNAVLRIMGAVKDVERTHLNELTLFAEKENNARIDLPFGIVAVKYGDDLYFYEKTDEKFEEEKFDAEKTYYYRGYAYRFVEAEGMIKGSTIDADKVKGAVIRTRRDGDKFCRVNGKNKLLSDFLNEKKLLSTEKDGLLLLASGSTVYAVLGVETAEEAKIDENTEKILHIVKEKKDL